MTLSNVVIAGGTGFIGRAIAEKLSESGTSVTVLTRNPVGRRAKKNVTYRSWAPDKLRAVGNDCAGWQETLERADAVINVAGHPILTRWNKGGKQLIIESRTKATKAIADAVVRMSPADRPKCIVNASAVGFYGGDGELYDESSGGGDGFLAEVCEKWEAEVDVLRQVAETRLVKIRIGIVLGVGGGAMKSMIPAFKLFVGGPLGNGKQWVPWVHLDDVVGIFIRAAEKSAMTGVYNATAPGVVNMNDMCKALGKALGRPSALPVPEVVIKLALGEASELLLDGSRVKARRLMEGGYEFRYEDIDSAMRAIAEKC